MQRKKKWRAKLLSMALAVAMVCALLPTAALATTTPEWTVTGWKDSYAVGDVVELTFSYPNATKYYVGGRTPDGLTIENSKESTGIYYTPLIDGTLKVTGTLTEDAVTTESGRAFNVSAYSDTAHLSDQNNKFVITAAPAPSPKRTTTLDLTTISTSNTMGATHSGGVYTNNVEKWVYDTTKNPAVLTLKGVDIETNDLFGIKLPTKDGGVTVDVVVEEGTVNNVQTTKTDVAFGEIAIALGCDYNNACSLHIKGAGTLNLSTSGDYGIALGTQNGELSISEATVTAKASGSTAAYALYATTSITVNSGTVYATASGFASFVNSKAYTIADTLEVKGSDTYDVTENLTAAAPNNDYYIHLGADGSGVVAKTIKIQPRPLYEIVLGTTEGYTNDDAGLRKAMTDIVENGVIKLGGDLTMTAKTEITSGKFVLDLGSYTFTGGGSSFAPELFVNGGELTVRATTGGITGRNAVGAIGVAAGKLTIEGGTFTGGPSDGSATPGDGLEAYAANPNIVLKGGTFAGGTGEGIRYAYAQALAGLIAPGYKAQWTDTGVDLTAEELASNDGYVDSFKIVPLDLTDLIAVANAAKSGVTVNAGPASSVTSGTKFVTQSEMDTFVAAIAEAQAVADDESASGEATAAASAALINAMETFNAAIKTGAHSGGSSGGSSAPSVNVPVTGGSGATKVTASVSGNTATVSNIDTSKLNAVGAANSTVTIDVSGLNKTISKVSLPVKSVGNIFKENAKGMEMVLSTGKVRFDAAALDAIADAAEGSTIHLEVKESKPSTLNTAQKEAISGLERMQLVDVTLTSNGVTISDFKGGSALVSVPYALKDGESSDGVAVYYLAKDGKQTKMETSHSSKTGMASFAAPHFSTYVVVYEKSAAWVNPFSDVGENDWFYDAVKYMHMEGLMSGTSANTFSPASTTTRGMIVTILYRMAGSPAASGSSAFTDVTAGAYYSNAVAWASANGIVDGYGDGRFGPNDTITREQMAAILYRYAQRKGQDVTVSAALSQFTDADTASGYAVDALRWAVGEGLISGKGSGVLGPKGAASRAQVAVILHRFAGNTIK